MFQASNGFQIGEMKTGGIYVIDPDGSPLALLSEHELEAVLEWNEARLHKARMDGAKVLAKWEPEKKPYRVDYQAGGEWHLERYFDGYEEAVDYASRTSTLSPMRVVDNA